MSPELRAELKPILSRALLNESEAGGGGFDDMADAVLDCLAYERITMFRRPPPEPSEVERLLKLRDAVARNGGTQARLDWIDMGLGIALSPLPYPAGS